MLHVIDNFVSSPVSSRTLRSVSAYWVALAIAASVAASVVAIPHLQQAGYLLFALPDKQLIAQTLSVEPGALAMLEASTDPTARYRAAKYYFAMKQPQLAYRQTGEGLELSGLGVNGAKKITPAADLPREQPAPARAQAARRLEALKATSPNDAPAHDLEVATTEAKLGMHEPSLKPVQQHLQAKKTDPVIVAKFSEIALEKPSKLVAVPQ